MGMEAYKDKQGTSTREPRARAAAAVTTNKPKYCLQDLDLIDNLQLIARIRAIDNRSARQIAEAICRKSALLSTLPDSSVDLNFLAIDGQLLEGGEHMRNLRMPLRDIVGANPWGFLNLVNRLRRMDFANLVFEGPEGMQARLEQRPMLLRLLSPSYRHASVNDIPAVLMGHLEYLAGINSVVPFYLIRFLMPVTPLLLVVLGWPLYRLWNPQNSLAAVFCLLASIPLGMTIMWLIRQHHWHRLLALFISFTDEFVVHELESGNTESAGRNSDDPA